MSKTFRPGPGLLELLARYAAATAPGLLPTIRIDDDCTEEEPMAAPPPEIVVPVRLELDAAALDDLAETLSATIAARLAAALPELIRGAAQSRTGAQRPTAKLRDMLDLPGLGAHVRVPPELLNGPIPPSLIQRYMYGPFGSTPLGGDVPAALTAEPDAEAR